ncbi:hypothetical protein M404DRAFT_995599 [Pisolithus tinctorius Marx 270]|uniref:Uncharacterized protein n=1 Tax=Pisolithus tinctorius Marx 270 TaxID=870435 RepID=A0A0C3PNH9_PISTI|nr:hypothetical protein M404DRAFT_995599 [Pisolithus tinctorius Marx 270]
MALPVTSGDRTMHMYPWSVLIKLRFRFVDRGANTCKRKRYEKLRKSTGFLCCHPDENILLPLFHTGLVKLLQGKSGSSYGRPVRHSVLPQLSKQRD